ncbi:MAG: HD domain-containing protein [Elusimicrobia bacterium]|nr:HD domain-containing protein [Elusimicrobiota bacterium]
MDITTAVLEAFGEAHLVGGALRDALLGRTFKDIDLAVPPSPGFEPALKRLARRLGASCFPLDEENRVYRLTAPGSPPLQLDIMPFVGGKLAADLARRDFTVNAMALRLGPGMKFAPKPKAGGFAFKPDRARVTDPFGGLADLRAGRIRPVSPGIFREDPVRLLRAFRLAAGLDYSIVPAALKAIRAQAGLIKDTAPERVREELMRLLESPESHKWLALMHRCGLLCAVFPDLAAQEKCAVAYYGKGGVLTHTLRVVERCDHLFIDPASYLPCYEKAAPLLPQPRLMKLAALLHDIAKPAKAAMVKGRLRFFGHEEHGAVMAEKVMEGLRFSRAEIKLVSAIIGTHLRPGNLAANDVISYRAMFRFFRSLGERTVPLLTLSWADHASYVTEAQLKRMKKKLKEEPKPLPPGLPYNSPKKTLRYMQVLGQLLCVYLKKDVPARTSRLVNGNDVIKTLRIPESPRVGEILEKIQLLQFEGRIKTREQALKALKGMK